MMDSGSREAWAKAALLVDEGARGRRRHIVGAAAQLLFLDARQGAAQVDADFGIGAAETVDYPEGAQLPRAGHADADRPCLSVGDGGCVLVGSPQRVQHVGHVAVVLPPGRRQLHPLGAAREQREAQLLLERLDLLADRRLRHVASLRRLGEAQRVGHGDKVLKLRRAHGGVLSSGVPASIPDVAFGTHAFRPCRWPKPRPLPHSPIWATESLPVSWVPCARCLS